MGKKNKKDKKGSGKEKTEKKMDKKAEKRLKKETMMKGEEDLEKMIASYVKQDKMKTQVIEEKHCQPSARCNMTLTTHPEKEELIMFGGEYFTGRQMFMYNDLFSYNIKKKEWMKISVPNAPPPRSAHQAVVLKQNGGQLWIFGGEFSSQNQNQFYHYKDLWVYQFKDKLWENIRVAGGPSARSGHRMVQCKKLLIVFGGFYDNGRSYKYYNDVHAFNVDNYTWSKIEAPGPVPCPRSGCVVTCLQDSWKVIVYGGYSKQQVKKDVDKGCCHTDMYALQMEVSGDDMEGSVPGKWKWTNVKQSGSRPSPRSGMSVVQTSNNQCICFGGVFDEEENDEQLSGKFYNQMYRLEIDKAKWYDIDLRGCQSAKEKKRRRQKKPAEDDETGEQEEMMELEDDTNKLKINQSDCSHNCDTPESAMCVDDMEGPTNNAASVDEPVFKMTIGEPSSSAKEETDFNAARSSEASCDVFVPSPRINTLLTVKSGILYMYGGICEDGDKQLTFSDFYSIDIQKLDKWNILIEDSKSQVWEESDSSSDEEDMEDGACGGEEDDESSDDSMDFVEVTFDDAPKREDDESVNGYFDRTKDYWIKQATSVCDSDGLDIPKSKLEKMASEMCESCFQD